MGAIVLDIKRVNSNVFPNFEKAITILGDTYDVSKNLKNKLPNSFSYKSTVNNIITNINSLKSKIKTINNKIEKKLQKVENIEGKEQKKISSLVSLLYTHGNKDINFSDVIVNSITTIFKNENQSNFFETGAEIISGFFCQIVQIGTKIDDKIIETKANVTNTFNAIVESINKKKNDTTEWLKEKFEQIKNEGNDFLESTGATIKPAVEFLWDRVKDTGTILKRTVATVGNVEISFTKGFLNVIERAGDLLVLAGSCGGTLGTATADIIEGIATGDWQWNNTKKIWDLTKATVSTECVNKLFDMYYDTKVGEFFEGNAYGLFKKDGIGCEIVEGLGEVAGIITLSVIPGGALGTSAELSLALAAGTTGFSGYTSEEWNKNSILLNYLGEELNIDLNYEKYSEIEKLKSGESTTITQQIILEDGTTFDLIFNIMSNGDGTYAITDNLGNIATLNSLDESSTVKGLIVGGIKGTWEGLQWFTGSKIGNGTFNKLTGKIQNVIMQKLAISGIRVGLDTITAAVEVPFQSLITMFSENKTWDEAWESEGGWSAVFSQVVIGTLASAGGEVIDIKKMLKSIKLLDIIESGNIDDKIRKEIYELGGNKLQALLELANEQGKLDLVTDMISPENLEKVMINLKPEVTDKINDNINKKILNNISDSNTIDEKISIQINKLDDNNLIKLLNEANSNKQLENVMPYLSVEKIKSIANSLDIETKHNIDILLFKSQGDNTISDLVDLYKLRESMIRDSHSSSYKEFLEFKNSDKYKEIMDGTLEDDYYDDLIFYYDDFEKKLLDVEKKFELVKPLNDKYYSNIEKLNKLLNNRFNNGSIDESIKFVENLSQDELEYMIYYFCSGDEMRSNVSKKIINEILPCCGNFEELVPNINDLKLLDNFYKFGGIDDNIKIKIAQNLSSEQINILLSNDEVATSGIRFYLLDNMNLTQKIDYIVNSNIAYEGNNIIYLIKDLPPNEMVNVLENFSGSYPAELNLILSNYSNLNELIDQIVNTNNVKNIFEFNNVENMLLYNHSLIEKIDDEHLAAIIRNVDENTNRLFYNNLEGTRKNKLALEYGLKEFYDERTAEFENYFNDTIIKKYKEKLGKFISDEKIDSLVGKNKYLSNEGFKALRKQENWMAFNDGSTSVMNTQYDDLIVKNNLCHENIHGLSSNDGIGVDGNKHTRRGLSIDRKNIGINETVTEYLTEIVMGDDYYTKATGGYYSGYQSAVERLKELIDRGIIDRDKLIQSYFSNDISYFKNEITSLCGEETYDELIKAFDDAISGDSEIEGLNKLDKLITKLDKAKWGG